MLLEGRQRAEREVQLIDFSKFLNGNETQRTDTAKAIVNGFQTAGFIYLSNTPIRPEVRKHVFDISAKLFTLDERKKKSMAWTTPQKNRGYSGPGREKVTQLEDIDEVAKLRQVTPDLKESFEMGRENEPGYPNVWPEETDPVPAGFKTTMIDWFLQCQAFNVEIMRAIGVGMGLGETYFDPFIDTGDNTLRLLHYPAVSRESFKTNPGQERAGAHTDYGTITLLFQDTHGGLQVESPSGQYVDVPPIEGTVVINVADLLARWSNDVLKSTMHRVVEPSPGHGDGDGDTYPARYVIA